LYLFAACRPGTDETFALALLRVSADAMTICLEHVSRQLEPGVHAVLIPDQAGWHDARALHVPGTLTPLPLPPASPALNRVERVWPYLRERYLSHRMLDDYEAVLEAVCRAWNRLLDETGRLTTWTACPYLTASAILRAGSTERFATELPDRTGSQSAPSRQQGPAAPRWLRPLRQWQAGTWDGSGSLRHHHGIGEERAPRFTSVPLNNGPLRPVCLKAIESSFGTSPGMAT
jgi:hypothetical protein